MERLHATAALDGVIPNALRLSVQALPLVAVLALAMQEETLPYVPATVTTLALTAPSQESAVPSHVSKDPAITRLETATAMWGGPAPTVRSQTVLDRQTVITKAYAR